MTKNNRNVAPARADSLRLGFQCLSLAVVVTAFVAIQKANGAPPQPSRAPAVSTGSTLKPGTTHYSDGTTVRRNNDGSIEVTDPGITQEIDLSTGNPIGPGNAAPAYAAPMTEAAGGSDDVIITRNADGSIEVDDSSTRHMFMGGSAPAGQSYGRSAPSYRSSGRSQVSYRPRHSGTHIQRNSDGSVEVWDNDEYQPSYGPRRASKRRH